MMASKNELEMDPGCSRENDNADIGDSDNSYDNYEDDEYATDDVVDGTRDRNETDEPSSSSNSYPFNYASWPGRKTAKICKYWIDGGCPKSAEECEFQHAGQVVRVNEKCKYYLTKGCRKGKACGFLHEEIPCTKFHLLEECDSQTPCRFSHESLTDLTRPMFEEEALIWRNSVEREIMEDEEEMADSFAVKDDDDDTRRGRVELLDKLNAAIKSKGIPDPDDDSPPVGVETGFSHTQEQEVDFSNFKGPSGFVSKIRYAMSGTFTNFLYAQRNAARFEAYDEMERRAVKLYNEISVESYAALSQHVRCLY